MRRCPLCEANLDAHYPLGTVKIFTSGSREAKRALRKGWARVFTRPGGMRARVNLVVCSHPCHYDVLDRIKYLPAFD